MSKLFLTEFFNQKVDSNCKMQNNNCNDDNECCCHVQCRFILQRKEQTRTNNVTKLTFRKLEVSE